MESQKQVVEVNRKMQCWVVKPAVAHTEYSVIHAHKLSVLATFLTWIKSFDRWSVAFDADSSN